MKRLRPFVFAGILLFSSLLSAAPGAAQVDVLTHRYDSARSGANLNETQLKKSNVNNSKFGMLAFRSWTATSMRSR